MRAFIITMAVAAAGPTVACAQLVADSDEPIDINGESLELIDDVFGKILRTGVSRLRMFV